MYEDLKTKLENIIPPKSMEELISPSGSSGKSVDKDQNMRLKKLRLKIEAIFGNMEEFEDTLDNYSKEIHEYQQKMLLEQLRNLTELHEEYIANATEEDLKTTYVTNNEYKDVKKDINRCLHQMASRLGETNKSGVDRTKYCETRLPQLKIPTFRGNFLEWQSFYDLYSTIIHNKGSLSTTEKMEYLKTHLEGEPLQLIQHLTISSQNYNSAWETLKSRYNNERKIVSMHIDKMLKAGQQGNSPSATSIKNILDATKEGLAALNNMGFDTTSWGPIIVHLTTKALDTESRNLFEQGLKEPNKMPSLTILLEFLQRRYQALDVLTTSKQKQYKCGDDSKHTIRNFYIASKAMHCTVYKGDHIIYSCPKFMNWTAKERYQQIKQAKICLNCLRHGKQSQCLSKRTCKYCNKKHHSLLHMEWPEKAPQVKQMEQQQRDSTKTTTKQVIHGHQNQNVLLATAILNASSSDELGHSVTIRALIDPGSQASLITESIVQSLRLKRQKAFVEQDTLADSRKRYKRIYSKMRIL